MGSYDAAHRAEYGLGDGIFLLYPFHQAVAGMLLPCITKVDGIGEIDSLGSLYQFDQMVEGSLIAPGLAQYLDLSLYQADQGFHL